MSAGLSMAAMIRAARIIFSLQVHVILASCCFFLSLGLSLKTAFPLRAMSHIPGLANVQDVNTVGAKLPEVRLHVNLEVLGSQVALSRQEHLDVLGRRVESRGELRGGHDGGWAIDRNAGDSGRVSWYQSSGSLPAGG